MWHERPCIVPVQSSCGSEHFFTPTTHGPFSAVDVPPYQRWALGVSPRGYSVPSTARGSHTPNLATLTDRSSFDLVIAPMYEVPNTARMWHEPF